MPETPPANERTAVSSQPEDSLFSSRFDRREAIKRGSAVAAMAALPSWLLSACGSGDSSSTASGSGGGKPIKIGFIPLTDCASIVMADVLGYYKKRGLNKVWVLHHQRDQLVVAVL